MFNPGRINIGAIRNPTPLEYLQEWLPGLALTSPEWNNAAAPAHYLYLHCTLSALVRWCTSLDPMQRPSMLLVSCLMHVLPRGAMAELPALYRARQAQLITVPLKAVDEEFLAGLECAIQGGSDADVAAAAAAACALAIAALDQPSAASGSEDADDHGKS
jgi:hypothetical protein